MRRKAPSARRRFLCPYCKGYWTREGLHSHKCAKQPCRICGKTPIGEYGDGGHEGQTCESCYWGMRLSPDIWLNSLKKRGIVPEHQGGCLAGERLVICRDAYTGQFGRRDEAAIEGRGDRVA